LLIGSSIKFLPLKIFACAVVGFGLASEIFGTEPLKPAESPVASQSALKRAFTPDKIQDPSEINLDERLPFEERHSDKPIMLILYDTRIDVKDDCSYTTNVIKKFRIQRREAKELGEIPIYYIKGRERVKDIKAYTITPDGQKHRYSRIQDYRVHQDYNMYSDTRKKIISMPEVNVGSVLTYESTIVSKRGQIKDAYLDCVYFNSSIPVKESNYTLTIPKSLNVRYKEFNLDYKPVITETEDTITYSWHIVDKDPKPEAERLQPPPTVGSISNIVEFSSIESWKDISDWYYGLVQKNLKISKRIEKAAKEAMEGRTDTKDKVRGVLEYIQENFRYVSMSFGDNALEPHPTTTVFRNKYGDCKDLSLLCMAMLETAGIKADMALFGDEISMTDPQYDLPYPTFFDHALLLVRDPEEGDYYIDPLLEGYDIGEYPLSYEAAYTFVITENGGMFGRLPHFDKMRRYERKTADITIMEGGSALTESDSLWDLDESINMRRTYNVLNGEQRKRVFEKIEASLDAKGKLYERRSEGLDRKYGTIKTYSKMLVNDAYPVIDDTIIIDIQNFNSTNLECFNEERKNPFSFWVNALSENTRTYRIPEDFRVSELPENLHLEIDFFTYKRTYELKDNVITVTETEEYSRKELPKEDWKRIKEYFEKLSRLSKQRIVIKKIKPWWQEIKDAFTRLRYK